MTRQRYPAVASLLLGVLGLLVAMPYPAGGAEQEPPERRVVYFDTDFEDGTLGPFYAAYCDQGCTRPRVTNEAAHSGQRAVKMETTSSRGWHSRLEFRWCGANKLGRKETPCNPAASNPDGLYQRFWIMLPQATIDAVARGKQLKLLLNRYDSQTTRKHKGGWWQAGFGPEFGSPRDGLRTLEDTGLDPDTNVSTGLRLEGGMWYKVETWYRRDSQKNKGRAVLWINGKKVADSGWLRGMGRDEAVAEQSAWFGLVYASVSEPLVVYVDDVAAASHRLE
jgi:hypothetical protein